MARSTRYRPGRTLAVLAGLLVLVYGGLAAAAQWGSATWAPKLALDLAGGTQVILTPVPQEGAEGEITSDTIDDAIAIMRQRVNSSGISEASVSSQGGQNIVVELPGDPAEQQQTLELVRQSAQMTFRPVLTVAGPTPAVAQPTDGPPSPATPSATSTSGSTAAPEPSGETSSAPAASEPAPQSTQGSVLPQALLQATPTTAPTPSPAAPSAAASPSATAAPSAAATPSATPTSPSDLSQVTPEIAQRFSSLDCTDPASRAGGTTDDPDAPLVTCDTEGTAKYLLGPVELVGSDIESASSQPATNNQGFSTGGWEVALDFTGAGGDKFADVTSRISQLPAPQNQFGVVLDGLVISAPSVSEPITGGAATINDGGSGTFTQESTQTLANQLRFGALPVSFEVQTEAQISATLGSEQLQRGLLAGLIGLALVVVYSLLQYRALGLVTVGSLGLAGLLTYGVIALLSWSSGYRLSLPGVAGLIVAIGVTADSFIVYFERVRDEVREGRSLVAAVQAGWGRARRTILISDTVQFLAAVVLYVLAVGGVKGFAFTLGITTLIDLAVVVLFTHPVLSILARRHFFASGHRLSGFDAEHLGRSVYLGRGRVRTPRGTGAPAPEADSTDVPLEQAGSGGRRSRVRAGVDEPELESPRRMTLAERRAAEAARARAAEQDAAEDAGADPDGVPVGVDGGVHTSGAHRADRDESSED